MVLVASAFTPLAFIATGTGTCRRERELGRNGPVQSHHSRVEGAPREAGRGPPPDAGRETTGSLV